MEKNYKILNKRWILLCTAFSFMLCIFAPLDIFFSNRSSFWFSLWDMIPVIFAAFSANMVFWVGISWVVKNRKYEEKIYAFALCALIYFYIQGNYVPRNYGVLNGSEINWEMYTSYSVISIILVLLCLVLCIVFCIKNL